MGDLRDLYMCLVIFSKITSKTIYDLFHLVARNVENTFSNYFLYRCACCILMGKKSCIMCNDSLVSDSIEYCLLHINRTSGFYTRALMLGRLIYYA